MTYSSTLDGSKVLIVSGYTDQELLLRANKKTKDQVSMPPSFFFDAKNVQVQPHRPKREQFESAEGLIPQETACDNFAQVTMEILVHQSLTDAKGELIINSQTREVRIITTDTDRNVLDKELQLGRYVRPEEFPDKYIEVRENFFKDLLNRPLTIVSQLFEPIELCYIEDYSYNIPEGEEEATYSVVFQEYSQLPYYSNSSKR